MNIDRKLAVPRVHLNGTSKTALIEQYLEAYRAVEKAITKVAANYPHARDYYVQGNEVVAQSQREHTSRIARLKEISKELEDIVQGIVNQ